MLLEALALGSAFIEANGDVEAFSGMEEEDTGQIQGSFRKET